MMDRRGVLFVRLPCQTIYPIGVTYLANHLHRHFPDLRQRILDLAVIPRRERRARLRETVEAFRPDLIAFSWRDIQIFAPHEEDSSLKTAFNFFYSPNPLKRIAAAVQGLGMMGRYYSDIHENLHLIREAHRRWGDQALIVLGGGAFSAFYEHLLRRLPEGVLGVIGEGEETLRKLVKGEPLNGDRTALRRNGHLEVGEQALPLDVRDFRVDFDHLYGIFPEIAAYADRPIGIQTKRGCHFECAFCIYPHIEGSAIRYRKPEWIVEEVVEHARRLGARRFWFTDAQFIPSLSTIPLCAELLGRLLATGLEIRWSSYIRTSLITPDLARLMVASGLEDLEVPITAGDQRVLNNLRMGFHLDDLMRGCRYLKEAGFKGKILLNYSLNAPGETAETLRKCVETYRQVAAILGEEQVHPFIFFLGIQPHTELERRLLREGYLAPGYNPLALNPMAARKMLYNPPPLDRVIARACLKAWDRPSENPGRDVLLHLEREIETLAR